MGGWTRGLDARGVAVVRASDPVTRLVWDDRQRAVSSSMLARDVYVSGEVSACERGGLRHTWCVFKPSQRRARAPSAAVSVVSVRVVPCGASIVASAASGRLFVPVCAHLCRHVAF
jgi:hypothetical protein